MSEKERERVERDYDALIARLPAMPYIPEHLRRPSTTDGSRERGKGRVSEAIEDLREIELQQVEAERNELADRVAELEGAHDALRDVLARRRIRNRNARPVLKCRPVWHWGRPGWV